MSQARSTTNAAVRAKRRRRGALGTLLLAAGLAVTAAGAPAGADGNEAPNNPAAFRALTGGSYHTCAIVDGGDVKCWGYNLSGQLGLGDTDNRGDETGEMAELPTVDLGTGRTATAITGGYDNTCAILDGGDVKCWGDNNFAQLGLGDTDDRGDETGEMGDDLPTVDLGTGRTATAIAIGGYHTCAILDGGDVKCWGGDGSGAIGLGDESYPGGLPGEMGDNLPEVDLGTGRTATAITAGTSHTCAILDDGSVKCWGSNTYGQLGQGDTTARGDGPNEMGNNLLAVNLGTGRTATAIAADDLFTCALLDNGTVKCWGNNAFGQLGQGDKNNRGDNASEMGNNLPAVDLGAGRTATAITTGSNHTCALLDNGTVKCWGAGSVGSLGQGSGADRGDGSGEMGDNLATTNLGTGRTVTVLTAGQGHTCAVLDNSALKCWGTNESGQLGQDDASNRGNSASQMGDNLPPVDLGGGGGADTTDPTVTLDTPADDAVYSHGLGVTIDFTCADDVAVASCVGDQNDGDFVDTFNSGEFTFTVTATDTSGNTATVTHNYTVEPQTCEGEPVTVDLATSDVPTAGNDVILGTPGADTINALGGLDVICGGGGADIINAGPGNDRVFGQAGNDTLRGLAGLDVLDGGNQNDTLDGGTQNDTLDGGNDNDTASGGGGNDTVRGANGVDTLNGLAGNDTLDGGAGNDRLNGGTQRDTCHGRSGRDTQTGCEVRTSIP